MMKLQIADCRLSIADRLLVTALSLCGMASGVRRRWYYLWGTIFVGCVLAAIVCWPSGEPRYQGRTLSEWLEAQNDSIEALTNAIGHMGTNAVPFLVKHIKYEEKRWRTATCQYIDNHFPASPTAMHVGEWLSRPSERKWMAAYAFKSFEPHAEEFVPLLAQYLDRPQSAFFAARALIFLGEKGFPPLLTTLTNKQTECSVAITVALGLGGTNAVSAIPALLHNLQSTNPQLVIASQRALNHITNRNTGPPIR